MQKIAHVRQDNQNNWIIHDLEDHLKEVAKYASSSAQVFQSQVIAELIGKWHDLGKYSQEFQQYICGVTGYNENAHIEYQERVNHSSAGALYAETIFSNEGKLGKFFARVIAYCIAGHHAGLSNWDNLSSRLDASQYILLDRAKEGGIPQDVLDSKPLVLPEFFKQNTVGNEIVHVWIRFLFSCLVDADFLDTEKFMNPTQHSERVNQTNLSDMANVFFGYMEQLQEGVETSDLNTHRHQIFQQCIQMGTKPTGVYTLTVPTGFGKTLSSLGFAFQHCKEHNKKRIIYVIPYTSIIEQTANIFRSIFGEDAVLEHHSNFDIAKETVHSRLACENWDVPLVVTTTVQFFESFYASKTSRCRKLHNIADAVVVIDETQLLPIEQLNPILSIIDNLVSFYKTSFLLCSATQPDFSVINKTAFQIKIPPRGLVTPITPIVQDVSALYSALERVKFIIPGDINQRENWDDIARQLQDQTQVLCIVNTRRDCLDLFEKMPEGTVCLSARMCSKHRSDVIQIIREKLKNNEPIRVISTQLIEAGVDISFPVVYRALCGLDSIAQAAGRCNREGKLACGQVVVFIPPTESPKGLLRYAEYATKTVLKKLQGEFKLSHTLFQQYFAEYYQKVPSFDQNSTIKKMTEGASILAFPFKDVGNEFHLIDQKTDTVYVRYYSDNQRNNEEIDIFFNQAQQGYLSRKIMRKLQQYTVSIYEKEIREHLQNGNIICTKDGLYLQQEGSLVYDSVRGLILPSSHMESLIY